jgi:hypothetical protein
MVDIWSSKRLDMLFFVSRCLSTMKILNYINCVVGCMLSASALVGSSSNRGRRGGVSAESAQQVISVCFSWGDARYKNILIGSGLCDGGGKFNHNASRDNYSQGLVAFFRSMVSGGHLSSDILDWLILGGGPDTNYRDRSGLTAWDYINRLPSSDRELWSNYMKSHLQTQPAGLGRVTPEEQERRSFNLALRTAARNGDLNGIKDALARGAQINDLGPKSRMTALDHAIDARHLEVVAYLRSKGGKRASEL